MAKKNLQMSTSAPFVVPRGQLMALSTRHAEALKRLDGQILADFDTDDDTWGSQRSLESEAQGSTAIISLVGLITQYASWWDPYFGQVSLESFTANLRAVAADPSVSSIVIYTDSGGGIAAQNADTADLIREISQKKPIVAFIAGDGCSAAYFLDSAASLIVASQTAIVGAVGTVIEFYDYTEALEEMGIKKLTYVSSVSPKKRLDPTSDEGAAEIQTLVDDFGEIFVEAVAGFRGVTREKVITDFGQGGVFVGAKALEAGLVDRIGTLEDALLAAQELAGAAGDSSTGETQLQTKARATAQGEILADKKTAAEIKAEHPEAAAAIAAEAVLGERTRIQGISKYNTAAHRAYGAKLIEAALADDSITADKLAVQLLDAQGEHLKAKAKAQEDDAVDVEEPENPVDAVEQAQARSGAKIPIASEIYRRMNGQGGK